MSLNQEHFHFRNQNLFILIFLLNKGPFCGVTDCPYFGLCVSIHVGFSGWFSPLQTYLLASGEPKGHLDIPPASSGGQAMVDC